MEYNKVIYYIRYGLEMGGARLVYGGRKGQMVFLLIYPTNTG